MTGIDAVQLAELEAAVEADPGGRRYPALAEVHRRAGRLEEAESVARRGLEHKPECTQGRLVLALVLLDRGRSGDARAELERLTPDVLADAGVADAGIGVGEAAGTVSESELERAFEAAETDAESLITPNRVAEEALQRVDAGAAEGLDEGDSDGDDILPGSAFATATMAELLARQGDASGAERIRASLGSGSAAGPPEGARRSEQALATLERWLARLRGDRS